MKKKLLTLVAVAVPLCVIFGLIGVGYYGYYLWWGQRHSVFYEVEYVQVEESVKEEGVYFLTYSVTVRNWPHDFEKHVYKLKEDIVGSYAGADFKANCRYFSSEPFKKNSFKFFVRYDSSTGEKATVEEMIENSRFIAIDADGNEVESASLYMSDNKKAPVYAADLYICRRQNNLALFRFRCYT